MDATTLQKAMPGADHARVLVTDYPIYADIAEWMVKHVTVSPSQ